MLVKVIKKESLGNNAGWLDFLLFKEETAYSKISLEIVGGIENVKEV